MRGQGLLPLGGTEEIRIIVTISLINLESKLLLAGSDTAAWGSHASLARVFSSKK